MSVESEQVWGPVCKVLFICIGSLLIALVLWGAASTIGEQVQSTKLTPLALCIEGYTPERCAVLFPHGEQP